MKKFLEDFANEKMAAKETGLSRGKNIQKRNEGNPASIQIVIAVVLENVPDNVTGGKHAAPIARRVLEKYFQIYG